MEELTEAIDRVRTRLAVRTVLLSSIEIAILVGVVALLAAIAFPAWPRWPWAIGLALAPILASYRLRRDRPSDEDIVLFLDRRLEAKETLLTAWEVRRDPPPLLAQTLARAHEIVRGADLRAVLPSIRPSRLAWLLPAVLFAAIAQLVPVHTTRGAVSDVSDLIVIEEAPALRRIESLAREELDPAHQAELEEAAERARELRERLNEGMERRDALEELEAIRRELTDARQGESDDERRARDAAIEALAAEPEMQRALEERDPVALDRAVERAAARREAADRERAREALQNASEAARDAGDRRLSDSLLNRDRLLERRAEQARLARELADALPELQAQRLRRQLDRLEREGDGAELSQATVDAMREAWSRLTPEERERLADAMARAQASENREAQARSEQRAQREVDADEMERRLREALENLDQLQGQCSGGNGIPMPGQGNGNGSGNGSGEGQGNANGNGNGEGNLAGPGEGGGHIESNGGSTPELRAGDGPLARVRPEMREGAPSQTTFEWVDPEGTPIPEGTPDPSGTTEAAPGESGAIERAPIPQDYRDHVRTYFGGSREGRR